MRFRPIDSDPLSFVDHPKCRGDAYLRRDGLLVTLKNMLELFRVVLITGRSGMGKTCLALDFCCDFKGQVVWISLTASEKDLKDFLIELSKPFTSLLSKEPFEEIRNNRKKIESLFFWIGERIKQEKTIFVLDDFHKIYGAVWLWDFFSILLYCLPENTRFLFIGRNQPPFPLWRFRSKQMIGVLEEESLAFTLDEVVCFLQLLGVNESKALKLFKKSSGRILKLKRLAERELENTCRF